MAQGQEENAFNEKLISDASRTNFRVVRPKPAPQKNPEPKGDVK